MRSWLPRVVRWRLIASFARVIAVEKPMQYSVPWTSLSIVFGIAIRATPSLTRTCEYDSVSSPPIVTRMSTPEVREVVEDPRRQVVQVVADRVAGALGLAHPRRQAGAAHLAHVRPRGVKDGPAGPLDRPGVRPVERSEVGLVGLGTGPEMGEPLPAAADAEGGVAGLGRAVDDALDDGVEAGDVAAAGQDRDAFRFGHAGRHATAVAAVRSGCDSASNADSRRRAGRDGAPGPVC